MAIRIQTRRDTAANWVSANPVLRAGEIGIETDTLKMKVGNGSSTWTQLTSYMNVVPSDFNTTLGGYLQVTDLNDTVAALDASQNLLIPNNSVIFEGVTEDSYELTLQATDPTADRTITLPDATGTVALTSNIPSNTDGLSEGTTNKYFTDERAQDAVAAALAAGTHTNITVSYDDNTNSISLNGAQTYSNEDAVDAVAAALAAGTHTNISVSYNDNGNAISLTGAVTYTDENAQDAVGNAVGNGLDYDDNTGAISVDPSEFALSAVGAPTADISLANYKITNLATPTSANDAANKAYVDNTTAGLNFHAAVHAATTANLDATYNNGTSGVGATLTANANGALVVDGHTLSVDERVLVKNQTTGLQNGIYVVTATGDGSNPYILTRAVDADNNPTGEIAYGDFTFVQSGTTNAGYGYIVNTTGTITVGTTSISYVQFNAGQTVIAGNGLTESSPGTFAIDTTITANLSGAQTLTNKTINLNDNTLTGTIAQFNTAVSDADLATLAGTETLTNKTINLSSNTLSGTTAQFNTALSDDNFATLAGTETLTNKTISGSSNTLSNIPNSALTNSSITINGSAVSLGGSTTVSVPTSATPTVAGTVFGRTNAGSGALYLTALGNSTANSVTGTGNTAIGYNSMNGLVGGANNTSIGYQAFTPSGNTNISNNTAIGAFAAGNSYIGGNNVAVGYFALTGTTANTASNNTAIGYQAGANGTTNLTTGSNNTLIGYNAGPSSATVSNEITLGDANITAFRIPGLSLTVNAANPIVQLTSTQTLTNKTLSSATLTGTLTAGGGVGTNGQFLQSTGSGLQWASVSSYSAPTIGSTSITSGGTFTTLPGVTSINGATVPSSGTLATLAGTETFTNKTLSTTSTSTVSTNTATTVDTTALSGFTTMKFVVSLKQGSKIRSSELIVQTDGTNVDYTEYGVVETGGTMNAVSVAASVSSTNCITTVYVANAATTNVTVKLVKILM